MFPTNFIHINLLNPYLRLNANHLPHLRLHQMCIMHVLGRISLVCGLITVVNAAKLEDLRYLYIMEHVCTLKYNVIRTPSVIP